MPRTLARLTMTVAVLLLVLTGCREVRQARTEATYDATGRLRLLTYDADGNAQPDTWAYMDGARVLRIEIDRDEDGAVERWEYYDANRSLEKVGLSQADDGIADSWLYRSRDGSIGSPPIGADIVAASGSQSVGVPQQVTPASPGISGTVLQSDRTPAANVRLQLRNVDTGTIAGRTVSDVNGAFSFAVSDPGLYVVEAVDDDDDGRVLAVSSPFNPASTTLPVTLVLPASKGLAAFFATAGPVLAAAAGAGVAAAIIGGRTTASPER